MKCSKCQKSFHLLSQVKRRHFMWFNSSDVHVNGIRLENARPVSESVFTNLPDFISAVTLQGVGTTNPVSEMRRAFPVSCVLATGLSCFHH